MVEPLNVEVRADCSAAVRDGAGLEALCNQRLLITGGTIPLLNHSAAMKKIGDAKKTIPW